MQWPLRTVPGVLNRDLGSLLAVVGLIYTVLKLKIRRRNNGSKKWHRFHRPKRDYSAQERTPLASQAHSYSGNLTVPFPFEAHKTYGVFSGYSALRMGMIPDPPRFRSHRDWSTGRARRRLLNTDPVIHGNSVCTKGADVTTMHRAHSRSLAEWPPSAPVPGQRTRSTGLPAYRPTGLPALGFSET